MASEQVKTFGELMTKASVTASYEYIAITVAANSWEVQDAIQQLVDDKNTQQHSQSTHQLHILRVQKICKLHDILQLGMLNEYRLTD